MTGTGLMVLVIVAVLKSLGFDIDEGTVTETVTSVAQIVGVVLALYGQYRRKDLKFGLLRK